MATLPTFQNKHSLFQRDARRRKFVVIVAARMARGANHSCYHHGVVGTSSQRGNVSVLNTDCTKDGQWIYRKTSVGSLICKLPGSSSVSWEAEHQFEAGLSPLTLASVHCRIRPVISVHALNTFVHLDIRDARRSIPRQSFSRFQPKSVHGGKRIMKTSSATVDQGNVLAWRTRR